MFFKKKKQTEQAESPSLPPMASSSPQQGQSVFAPGLNPNPARLDFGFGPSAEPAPAPPKYSSVSDISAYPQPAPPSAGFSSMDPAPAWDSGLPMDQPASGGWVSNLQASAEVAPAMPNAAGLPEPLWPMADSNPTMDMPATGSMPGADWMSAMPSPEGNPAYPATDSFPDYIPSPPDASIAEPASPAELSWQETPYVMPTAEEPMPGMPMAFPESNPTFEATATAAPSQYEFSDTGAFAEMPLPSYDAAAPIDLQADFQTDFQTSFQPEFPAAGMPEPFQPSFTTDASHSDDDALWNDFDASATATDDSMHPMAPGAFLDSVGQELYPSDPFSSSEQSDLLASEQAFEEAAQYLFPETMGAPLEWGDEHAEPALGGEHFGTEAYLLNQAPALDPVLDLGPSFMTDATGFNDISVVDDDPAPFASFETPMAATLPEASWQAPPVPPEPKEMVSPAESSMLPTDEDAFSSIEAANRALNAGLETEPATAAYHVSATADQEAATTIESTAPMDDWMASSAPAAESSWSDAPATQLDEPFPLPDVTTPLESANTPAEPVLEFGGSFEDGFATHDAMAADDDAVNAYDLNAMPVTWEAPAPTTPDTAPFPVSQASGSSLNLAPVEPVADYAPSDSWFSEDEPTSALNLPEPEAFAPSIEQPAETWDLSPSLAEPAAFVPEAGLSGISSDPFASPAPMPDEPFPPVVQSSQAIAPSADDHPDDDFYAVSFTLNELGELVPADTENAANDFLPEPEPLPPPLPADALAPPAPEAPSLAPQTPMEEPFIADPFDAFSAPVAALEETPWPETPAQKESTPSEAFHPSEPAEPAIPAIPEPAAAATAAALTAAQAAPPPPIEEAPQPRRIQPKPMMQRTPKAPQPPQDQLEAQWQSQPDPGAQVVTKPAPQPQASDLMLGNLDIISVCVLTPEKRLLIIHNSGIFALMGQSGVDHPQISVLKVFDHNPIAYQNTFTAVEEGQAGSQGMYVAQVGTWHGIISTFQDKITLHTELG